MDLVKEVREGQDVEFNCLVKGIPLPTIRWIFRNQDIRNIKESEYEITYGDLYLTEGTTFFCDGGQQAIFFKRLKTILNLIKLENVQGHSIVCETRIVYIFLIFWRMNFVSSSSS